ncbi:MAG: DUF4159 domain-containing protein [Planctomycetota bacterium]|jgi:hypothetical protein
MIDAETQLYRREFLCKTGRTLAGATFAGSIIGATDQANAAAGETDELDKYDFLMPRVKFQCNMQVNDKWNAFPGGDQNLLRKFSEVVRCRVKNVPDCVNNEPHDGHDRQFNAVVDLTNIEDLRKYPFLFMTASGSYTLSVNKKKNIRHYIEEGGFLFMDDCVHGKQDDGDYFFRSSYKILEEIFTVGSVKRIPNEHEVFHNVYDFGDMGLPYIIGKNHGAHGIILDDRLAVLLSGTDLHCGWTDGRGWWFGKGGRQGVGRHGHKEAIMMGINILMYAMSH